MWKKRVKLGSDRVCSVNTDSWSLPPGGSTSEFTAEPRAMMGPHCQLSLPSTLSSSPLSTDDNSTCTRAGSRGRHARWSKGVTRRGLHHTILETCFIKCVRQMSSPLNPFPSGPSMSPSFPVIFLQSSSQPNLYLLPSLLDNFFFPVTSKSSPSLILKSGSPLLHGVGVSAWCPAQEALFCSKVSSSKQVSVQASLP